MTNAEVGAIIRNIRRDRGMRQVEVHDLTGLSQGYLSELENGRKPLSIGAAASLEYALKTKRGELIRWVPDLTDSLRSRVEDMPWYVNRTMVALGGWASALRSPMDVVAAN